MKAAIYHRVANKQDTSRYEIEQEIKRLKNEAEKDKFDVVMSEYDYGSGLNYEREGFCKIKDAIKNKQIDVLIINDIAAIGRNMFNNFEFFNFLEDNNVDLYIMQDNRKI